MAIGLLPAGAVLGAERAEVLAVTVVAAVDGVIE